MRLHPLDRWHRLLFRFSTHLSVPGFDVRVLGNGDEVGRVAAKISDAVDLLSRYSPVRLNHLERDLPRIAVTATHHRGQCLFGVGICVLQAEFVMAGTTDPARVAMLLVHEGTHARLIRAGFDYSEGRRARIERICIRAELFVARRIPEAQHLVTDAEKRLNRPDEFWSDAAFRARDVQEFGSLAKVAYAINRSLVAVQRFLRNRAA